MVMRKESVLIVRVRGALSSWATKGRGLGQFIGLVSRAVLWAILIVSLILTAKTGIDSYSIILVAM